MNRNYFIPAITLLALLVAWEVLVRLLGIREFILPAPSRIAAVIAHDSRLLLPNLLVTIEEMVFGFTLAFLVAMASGYLIAHVPSLRLALYPLVISSQTIPVIAIAPILIIWFGYNIVPKVLVTALVSFFPLTINTVTGYLSVSDEHVRFFETMNASRWLLFRKLYWPSALPFIFAGAKVSAALSVIGATVGEWVGSDRGLGHLIVLDTNQIYTARVFGSIVLLSLTGLALFGVVALVERWMTPWRRHA